MVRCWGAVVVIYLSFLLLPLIFKSASPTTHTHIHTHARAPTNSSWPHTPSSHGLTHASFSSERIKAAALVGLTVC